MGKTLPCYSITGKMSFKPLIRKEEFSNKTPKNGLKSKLFPCYCSITGKAGGFRGKEPEADSA
jgi:hypothetical protein